MRSRCRLTTAAERRSGQVGDRQFAIHRERKNCSTLIVLLADAKYESVFRAYGIDVNRPREAEARIRNSAIKSRLINTLEAWIPLRPDARAPPGGGPGQSRFAAGRVPSRPAGSAGEAGLSPTTRIGQPRRFGVLAVCPSGSVARTRREGASEGAIRLLRSAQECYPTDYLAEFRIGGFPGIRHAAAACPKRYGS